MTPIVPTAPGLFSTITFQPSPSESAVATMRARMSGGVLAEYGTTIRMTPAGYGCASAGRKAVAQRPIAAVPAIATVDRNARLVIMAVLLARCRLGGARRAKSAVHGEFAIEPCAFLR